jgi:LPS export ABC transporter protein LptC
VLNQYVNGSQQWRVKADKVSSVGGEDDFRLQKINAVLYDEKGKEKARFRGNEGLYEKKKEVVTLMGRAKVFMVDGGWTLKSEKLSYNMKSHKVNTSTAVSVVGKDVKIKGSGLLYDMKSSFLRIDGRVKCDLS